MSEAKNRVNIVVFIGLLLMFELLKTWQLIKGLILGKRDEYSDKDKPWGSLTYRPSIVYTRRISHMAELIAENIVMTQQVCTGEIKDQVRFW
jgi:hypothetical protein